MIQHCLSCSDNDLLKDSISLHSPGDPILFDDQQDDIDLLCYETLDG